MARQYKNIQTYLSSHNFTLLPTVKEYIANKKVIFKCVKEHTTTLGEKSFFNKKYKYKDNIEFLCTDCEKEYNQQLRFKEKTEEVLQNTGHILLELNTDKSCKYKCGNCGSIKHCFIHNLNDNTGHCSSCFEQKKNSEEDVRELLSKINYSLVSYKDCHNVTMKCDNEHTFIGTLHDIRRARRCPECAPERRKQTNLKIYGVENVFQSEEIKEKIKDTNMERYGVPHHLQNPEILEKLKQTCMEKFNVEFSFCQDWVYEKIQKTNMERYGVKYPLQSKEILDKIKKTIFERYNLEYFINSKECKRIMMEKYDSEYYITSQHFKNYMLDTYGHENPMHVPELFHKAIKSSFSKKEFILPKTGRKCIIMGYEGRCIKNILSKKNKFLKRMIEEDEIITGIEVPSFIYYSDDKKHRYYPDIWIKDTILIYEVKSIYIYNRDPHVNLLKFQEVAKQGYVLYVYLYDRKKLVDIWSFKSGFRPTGREASGGNIKENMIQTYSFLRDKKHINIEFGRELHPGWNVKPQIIFEDENNNEIIFEEDEVLFNVNIMFEEIERAFEQFSQ